MKKLSLLFTIVTLILTSCSSDDNNLDTSGNLLGEWEMQSLNFSGDLTTNTFGQTIVADVFAEASNINYKLTFGENPNIVSSTGDFSVIITTTVLGETDTQTIDSFSGLVSADLIEGEESPETAEWQRTENIISFTNQDTTETYTILELTETTLRLTTTFNEPVEQGGITFDSDITGVLVFTR